MLPHSYYSFPSEAQLSYFVINLLEGRFLKIKALNRRRLLKLLLESCLAALLRRAQALDRTLFHSEP